MKELFVFVLFLVADYGGEAKAFRFHDTQPKTLEECQQMERYWRSNEEVAKQIIDQGFPIHRAKAVLSWCTKVDT